MGLKDAIRKAQDEREGKAPAPPAAPAAPPPPPADTSAETLARSIGDPQSRRPQDPAAPAPALDETAIQKILDRIEEIPTLPVIATQVMNTINNPLSDAKGISDIIKNDQALSAKVLKMANSVYYKGYSEITSIQTAVARLGIMQVKRIVFTVSVFDTFDALPDFDFSLRDFWHHSMAVATAARLIGDKTGAPDLEDLYTAGILHDIGKLIMARHIKVMFGEVLDFLKRNPLYTFHAAERELFPFTHCHVGSWLAVKWNLSRKIQNVIFGHHEPLLDTTTFTREVLLFPAIVHIANHLAKKHAFGSATDAVDELIPESLPFVFGKKATLAQIEEKFLGEKPKIEAFLAGMKG